MAAAGGGRCKIIPNADCRGGRQASSPGAGETGPAAAPAAAPPPRTPSGLAGRSAGLAHSWPRLRLLLQERRFPMLPLAFPFLESPPLAAWDTQHCLGPRPLTGGAGAGHTAREDHQALRALGAGRLRATVRASSSLKPIAPGVKPAGKPLGDAWLLGTSCARPNALCWDWWGAEACTRCLRRPPNGPPRCLFSFATRRGHRACRLS